MTRLVIVLVGLAFVLSVQAKPKNVARTAKLSGGEYGFTKIIVIQRHPINSSHVYTYHQEGLKPGGGLWVCDFSSGKPELTQILDSARGGGVGCQSSL